MRPILITGATGTLGRAFVRICADRGLACHQSSRAELDIASADSVAAALDRHEPWLVINAAGYVRVDDAEHDPERCHRDNALGPSTLAGCCVRAGVALVTFSSDLVFDGTKSEPYEEHDSPRPLGVYGRTKHEGEQRVLDAHPASLVVRTSAFFGPWDEHNFVVQTLRELAAGRTVRAAADTTISPTYVPDLVNACLDLAIDGEAGIWHLANAGATTWAQLARSAARLHGHDDARVISVPMASLALRAPRPPFSVLGSARGVLLPRLDDALGRHHQATAQEAA
ncbi:MAG TPA: SDR family oxidoreductase [Kofleriaceae bacterium]|jgi:dTDP-4-dehydrorhamnose reductase